MKAGRPKTILYDLTPLKTESCVRGIGRYVRELAVGLSSLGDDELRGLRLVGLTRLTWRGDFELTDDLASYTGATGNETLSRANHYGWAYAHRVALWRAVRRIGADAVHLGDPGATPLLMKLTRCRRIVTCHDLIATRYPAHYFSARDGGAWLGARIERRRFASADHVVAISDATLKDAIDLLGLPPRRLTRVYNGVDIDRWSRPGASAHDDDAALARHCLGDRPYVLYVGDADWRKNQGGMLGGLAMARRRGVDVLLAWAGRLSTERRASVQRDAEAFGVSGEVRFLDFVTDDDLATLYRRARAHLFVSRAEGFGLTVVEAMAAGCPVITTRAGSLGEVAGDAALTVDPDDHGAIGDAITRVCEDDDLRVELGARGRARARLFSVEVQAREMARVYRRVCGIQ